MARAITLSIRKDGRGLASLTDKAFARSLSTKRIIHQDQDLDADGALIELFLYYLHKYSRLDKK